MAAEENNNLVWNNLLTRMRQQMYYAQDYAHNVLQLDLLITLRSWSILGRKNNPDLNLYLDPHQNLLLLRSSFFLFLVFM